MGDFFKEDFELEGTELTSNTGEDLSSIYDFREISIKGYQYVPKDNYELKFESIAGDFDNFNGLWRIENYPGEGIKINFNVDYNLGIPVIEEVLGDILQEKMKNNIDSMIKAVSDKLRSGGVEERKFKRFPVNKYNNIAVGNRIFRARIVNISPKGILFSYHPGFDAIFDNIRLGEVSIEIDEFFNDFSNRNCRVIFKEEISKDDLNRIIKWSNTKNIRRHNRKRIEKDIIIGLSMDQVKVNLIDLSCEGLNLKFMHDSIELGDSLELAGELIPIRKSHYNTQENSARVQFSEVLEPDQYESILNSPEMAWSILVTARLLNC